MCPKGRSNATGTYDERRHKVVNTAAELACGLAGTRGRLLVLAGAGLSTASGIGDYRDASGAYKRPPPVTVQTFMASHGARQRYWARSLFGWPSFAAARPNRAHRALAALEAAGWLAGTITQNVDGLQQEAGSKRVLELHGNLHQVACTRCGHRVPRAEIQSQLAERNAGLRGLTAAPAPDGDADLEGPELARVQIPDCERCSGILRPTVVFFGDSVPKPVVEQGYRWVADCRALLIVGSSVMIHSSFRFCRRAQALNVPIFAINAGRTRADEFLELKVADPCETVLPSLCQHWDVALPQEPGNQRAVRRSK